MFSIEVTNGLWKLFIPWQIVCRNCLFHDGQFEELFYSSTTGLGNLFSSINNLREFFYSLTNHHLRNLWCVELDFLIFSIVFIHEVCDKMSNSNIPDPNEENQQLLGRLWDATKRRGDGKGYCPCSQCRGFKRRIIFIATSTKHCREHGHTEC